MDELDEIVASAPGRIASISSLAELDELESQLTGRRSAIAESRRGLAQLPPEQRPERGAALNEASRKLQTLLQGKRAQLERAAEDALLADDGLDVTLAEVEYSPATHHLITQTMQEVADIFVALGYQIADGPEVETAWHNFDALNTPWWHPARLESDTMYVDFGAPEDELVLRTHTSPVQARVMVNQPPPVFVVVPGRCYRTDTYDATHSPVFHQVEGLAVSDGITFADLKGTLQYFAREYFGKDREIRLMPDFFPFTEPSAQLHVSCFVCDGSGCRVCSQSGWVELLGCGMVDPKVFVEVGYDPDAVTGFAFGMGVERLALVRHGITDIRHFFDNDVRTNLQFL